MYLHNIDALIMFEWLLRANLCSGPRSRKPGSCLRGVADQYRTRCSLRVLCERFQRGQGENVASTSVHECAGETEDAVGEGDVRRGGLGGLQALTGELEGGGRMAIAGGIIL